ncbi:MAG: cell division ATP-binding protein FtsE [Bdellovibrionota bacterium]
MIQLKHVYKTYAQGTHALKNVSFEIERGEFIFLSGPSGAGKTTLFKLLTTYDMPSSGHINVNGYNFSGITLNQVAEFRRKMGIVFQDFKLLKDRNLLENIALPLRVRKEKENYIKMKVEEILERVGLAGKADYLPDMLSGGEQQRVALARAVINNPMILIADEPTGNLDTETTDVIFDLIESLSTKGTTVIVATHDKRVIAERNKRVILLKDGEVTA